ncbi:putative RING-H2 finger protein ATL35 [Cynara cardunculus var. scolymus]|uniref:putative RING-H2 finger protein ATL35 n=1 Tax=Cynara cardunculus var. scolymus TaxID=59895 RepID=UPI000D62C01A|nr:putative RING-H2 finger protein ATL35 [Cynara cardunculus var. scolymus]
METVEVSLVIAMLNHSLTLIFTNKLTIFLTLITSFILRRIFHNIRCRRRFPIIVLKPCSDKTGGRGSTKAVYCAVCLHHVAGGERYRKLPLCHHCFHVECIDPWFELKSTCPLCRSQLPLNLLPPRTQQEPPSFVAMALKFSVNAVHDKIKCRLSRIKIKLNWM